MGGGSPYCVGLLLTDSTAMDRLKLERPGSAWDAIPRAFAEQVLDTGHYPGHAGEFETSFAMHVFPENVRPEAIPSSQDDGASVATAAKGRLLAEKAVEGVIAVLEDMLSK